MALDLNAPSNALLKRRLDNMTYTPPAPVVEEQEVDPGFSDYATVAGVGAAGLLPNAASGAIEAFQGAGGASVADPDVFEKFTDTVSEHNQAFEAFKTRRLGEDSFFGDMVDPGSVGRSITPMVAGIAASANPEPVTKSGMIAGLGAYNYRGEAFRQAKEYLKAENAKKLRETGKPLTTEEEAAVVDRYAPNIRQAAAAEAGFETVSDLVGGRLLRGMGKLGGRLLRGQADGALKAVRNTAANYVGTLGVETATEIPTHIFQEKSTRGTLLEAPKEDQTDFDVPGITKAAKEVFPAVVGTTLIVGGGSVLANTALNRAAENRVAREAGVDMKKTSRKELRNRAMFLQQSIAQGTPISDKAAFDYLRTGSFDPAEKVAQQAEYNAEQEATTGEQLNLDIDLTPGQRPAPLPENLLEATPIELMSAPAEVMAKRKKDELKSLAEAQLEVLGGEGTVPNNKEALIQFVRGNAARITNIVQAEAQGQAPTPAATPQAGEQLDLFNQPAAPPAAEPPITEQLPLVDTPFNVDPTGQQGEQLPLFEGAPQAQEQPVTTESEQLELPLQEEQQLELPEDARVAVQQNILDTPTQTLGSRKLASLNRELEQQHVILGTDADPGVGRRNNKAQAIKELKANAPLVIEALNAPAESAPVEEAPVEEAPAEVPDLGENITVDNKDGRFRVVKLDKNGKVHRILREGSATQTQQEVVNRYQQDQAPAPVEQTPAAVQQQDRDAYAFSEEFNPQQFVEETREGPQGLNAEMLPEYLSRFPEHAETLGAYITEQRPDLAEAVAAAMPQKATTGTAFLKQYGLSAPREGWDLLGGVPQLTVGNEASELRALLNDAGITSGRGGGQFENGIYKAIDSAIKAQEQTQFRKTEQAETTQQYDVNQQPIPALEALRESNGANIREVQPSAMLANLAESIRRLTGVNITYFASDKPVGYSGVKTSETQVYVSTNEGEAPHRFVLGHEIFHTVEKELEKTKAGRELLKTMHSKILAMDKGRRRRFMDQATGGRVTEGSIGTRKALIELRADVFATYFDNEQFWQEVTAEIEGVSLARSLGARLTAFVDKLILRSAGYDTLVNQLRSARKEISTSFGRHIAERENTEKTPADLRINPEEPQFLFVPATADRVGSFSELVDGTTKVEIPDNAMGLTREGYTRLIRKTLKGDMTGVPLSEVMEHTELTQAYGDISARLVLAKRPEEDSKVLGEVRTPAGGGPPTIVVYFDVGKQFESLGAYERALNAKDAKLDYLPRIDSLSLRLSILHEVQHIIQRQEGFARGANHAVISTNQQIKDAAITGHIQLGMAIELRKARTPAAREEILQKLADIHVAEPELYQNVLDLATDTDRYPTTESLVKLQRQWRETAVEKMSTEAYLHALGEEEARRVEDRINMPDGRRLGTPFQQPANEVGVVDPKNLYDNWADPQSIGGFDLGSTRAARTTGVELNRNNPDIQFRRTQINTPEFKQWFGDSKVVEANGDPQVMYHGTRSDFSVFRPSPDSNGLIYLTDDTKVASDYATTARAGYKELANFDDRTRLKMLTQVHPDHFEGKMLSRDVPGDLLGEILYGSRVEEVQTIGERFEEKAITAQQAIKEFNDFVENTFADGSVMPVYVKAETPYASKLDPIPWENAERTGAEGFRELGYDSVWVTEDDGAALAVFTPTQIKSAVSNNGQFDATNPDTQFRLNGLDTIASNVYANVGRQKDAAAHIIKQAQDKDGRSKLHSAMLSKAVRVLPTNDLRDLLGHKLPFLNKAADVLDDMVNARKAIIQEASPSFDALQKKYSEDLPAVLTLATKASYAQMSSFETIDQQDWAGTRQRRKDMTKEQRIAAAEKAWQDEKMHIKLGMSYRKAYADMMKARAAVKSKGALAEYQRLLEAASKIYQDNLRLQEETIREVAGENEEALRILRGKLIPGGRIRGDYWPLSRSGKYGIYIRRKNSENPEDYSFATFHTMAEQWYALESAKLNYGTEEYEIYGSQADDVSIGGANVPKGFVDALNKNLEGRLKQYNIGADKIDTLVRENVELWIRRQPESSALRTSLQRKTVRGADEQQALNSMSRYLSQQSARFASAKYGRGLTDILDKAVEDSQDTARKNNTVEDPVGRAVVDTLRARLKATKDETTNVLSRGGTKLSSMWYLASPSAYFVQSSQPLVTTLPRLMAQFGPERAIPILSGAMKDVVARGNDYSMDKLFARYEDAEGDVKVAIRAYERLVMATEGFNTLNFSAKTRNPDLQNIGNPEVTSGVNRDSIMRELKALTPKQQELVAIKMAVRNGVMSATLVNEVLEVADNQQKTGIHRALMFFMKKGEEHSRLASYLAFFRASTKSGKGFDDAVTHASHHTNNTMIDFDKEVKPVMLQKATVRMLTQFQYFRFGMITRTLVMSSKMIDMDNSLSPEERRQARSELKYMVAMSVVVGGAVASLPGAGLIMAAQMLLGNDDDDPRDIKSEVVAELSKIPGGDTLAYGLPGAIGMDLARRIGLADLVGLGNPTPDTVEGGAWVDRTVMDLLGPSVSLARSVIDGFSKVNNGEVYKGVTTMMPKGAKDVMKAAKLYYDGAETGSGKTLINSDDVHLHEVIFQMFGFAPLEPSLAYTTERGLTTVNRRLQARRAELADKYMDAFENDDEAGLEDAKQDMRKFRAKNPLFGDFSTLLNSRAMTLAKNKLGIDSLALQKIKTSRPEYRNINDRPEPGNR